MALTRRFVSHSAAYAAGSVFERALGFLLVPFYTRALAPEELGTVSLARTLAELLVVFFTLGLQSGASRLYFDYRNDPEELKRFWGTLFTTLLTLSLVGASALLLVGEPLLTLGYGELRFFPYMVLAIVTAALSPITSVYLRTLQARMMPRLYLALNLSRALLSLALIVGLVLGAGMRAEGVLLAAASTSGLYFFVTLWLLRRDIYFGFEWRHLRHALGYSLPVFPGFFTHVVRQIASRVLVGRMVGFASLGIYQIAFSFGNALAIIATAVNSAFSPFFLDAMGRGDAERLEELRDISLLVVVTYCMAGAGLAALSYEVCWVVVGDRYSESFVLIPILAFASVARGIYFVFSSVVQYFRVTLWIGTGISFAVTVFDVVLNVALIERFGVIGAASAAVASQVLQAVLTAIAGARHAVVQWPYLRFALLFVVSFAVALALSSWFGEWWHVPAKLGALAVLAIALSTVAWGRPLYLVERLRRALRPRRSG